MTEDPRIQEAVRAALSRHMDRVALNVLTGSSNYTTATPTPPLNVVALLKMVRDIDLASKRNRIEIVVDAGHEGPIVSHKDAHGGAVIECAPQDAVAIHERWPLKLDKAHNKWCASFRPANVGEYASLMLVVPPWDLPPSEEEPTL